VAAIKEAYDAGQRHFGENYVCIVLSLKCQSFFNENALGTGACRESTPGIIINICYLH